MSAEAGQGYTEDSLFDGALRCWQPRAGYRFSVDAVLLGHFSAPRPGDRILDLGAGCGIVSLILAYRWPEVRITALELQPELADLSRLNAEINGFSDRFSVITGDFGLIREQVAAGSFDWVFCNPPYRNPADGRVSTDAVQALARHELQADLPAVARAAAFALRNRGRAVFIYPASRLPGLIFTMKNHGLEPKRLQSIHSYPGGEGKLVLLEAVKGGGVEMKLLPPFSIYQEAGGVYTPAMATRYRK
ncbi:MAG: hypothetical protein A2521_14185 [Deltaproteobacteria bacterium RIFOXYD12_FULL_57_12]|nr:MAG: hypothetical protein A2521_14185 [Deltaproteobacteria bacterium RIFOXYD12_FULL_57_12]